MRRNRFLFLHSFLSSFLLVPTMSEYTGALAFLENSEDITDNVIEFLTRVDLLALGAVSRHWRRVTLQERWWKRLAIREYGLLAKQCNHLSSHFSAVEDENGFVGKSCLENQLLANATNLDSWDFLSRQKMTRMNRWRRFTLIYSGEFDISREF